MSGNHTCQKSISSRGYVMYEQMRYNIIIINEHYYNKLDKKVQTRHECVTQCCNLHKEPRKITLYFVLILLLFV